MERNFIVAALRRIGLQSHFTNLIHAYISTPTFSILVNGEVSSQFHPNRGIHQGCPLSPYLFVVAINLSISFQHELHNSNLAVVTLGPGCLPIHSLLFADDLMLCGRATKQEATTIKTPLNNFYNRWGQIPNLQKSAITFSKNAPTNVRNSIKNIFPVPDLSPSTIHLGHPLIFNHNDKNKAYEFIINKFQAKLTTVKTNKLNHAGRLTYIQSVLSPIPVYYMSTVLFSKAFVERIIAIIRRFWWTGV